VQPPRSHRHRPDPTGSIGQEYKTRVQGRHGSSSKWAAQGSFFVPVAIGGIVVRELFQAGGGKSVPLRQGTGAATAPERHRTARRGSPNMFRGGEWQKEHPQGRSRDGGPGGTGGSTELLCSGGPRGQAAPNDHGDRKATPPDHVAALVLNNVSLALGMLVKDSRPATTRHLMSNTRRALQGQIVSILGYGVPHGSKTVRSMRGFLPTISLV
jgi:hypothetical protein